jgi:hypothetical protein
MIPAAAWPMALLLMNFSSKQHPSYRGPARRFAVAMQIAAIVLLFGFGSMAEAQTTYFWDGTNDITLTTSWGTSTDGTGSEPSDFTSPSQIFLVQAGQSASYSASWTLGGSSILRIADGGLLTTSETMESLTLQVQSGGQFDVSGSFSNVVSRVGTEFAPGSVVRILNNSFSGSKDYGNLYFEGSDFTPSSFTAANDVEIRQNEIRLVSDGSNASRSWDITGDLTISSGAILSLAGGSGGTGNGTISIGGDLDNLGTMSRTGTPAGTTLIEFVGSGGGDAKWGLNSGAFDVTVGAGRSMNFSDSLSNTGGALTVEGTLSGSSSIAGATTINGKHSVGGSTVGTQTFSNGLNYGSGSIFEWDLISSSTSGAGTNFDSLSVTGVLSATDAIFKVVLSGSALTDIQVNGDTFWDPPSGKQEWSLASIFGTSVSGFTSVQTNTNVSSFGSFSIDGTNLTWTAVPEPSNLLAGMLLAAGLLRRRRRVVSA